MKIMLHIVQKVVNRLKCRVERYQLLTIGCVCGMEEKILVTLMIDNMK